MPGTRSAADRRDSLGYDYDMEVVVTSAVAKAAGSAAGKLLGGMIPGAVREFRRKRSIRRTVKGLSERTPADRVIDDLTADEVGRLVSYVRLPDFEQLAIQLTGLVLERRRPEKYVDDLRAGLARSLELNSVTAGETAKAVAESLLDELWAAVVLAIGEIGPSHHPADMPGVTVGVSTRAAAAARNCRLLERLETLDTVHSTSAAIRSQVGKIEGHLRPPHMSSGQRVPLSRLYVEPHLEKHVPGEVLQSTVRLAPKDLVAQHLRTVVLGNPGNGKSTLVAKLAIDLARSPQARDTVPFLVVMREFAQRLERDQLSVAHYLRLLANSRYQVGATEDYIEFLLLNGRAVVFFDGLDELLDTSLRRRVTDAVEAFASRYPTTSILATSRQVGYDQAQLDPALFTAYRLAEFDEEQVAAYAGKWFALDPALPRETQRELTETFLRESEYVGDDVRRNPLMLALMCALYRGEGYIPRNRLDLYERCSVLLFERWDRMRGIRVPLPFEQHVRPALWSLALSMFTAVDTHAEWAERELVTTVRRFLLERRFEDVDEAEAAARTFVEYCRGRAWVLTEVGTTRDGEPLFAFTHRTFLEFFAANQLVREHPGADSLLRELLPRIHRTEWDVVAQLAVLLLDRNVDGGADEFLNLLVQDAETRPAEDRPPGLTFAARLLSSFVPTPRTTRRVVNACWEAASTVDGDGPDPTPSQAGLAWLLVAAEENREQIVTLIRQQARDHARSGITAVLSVTLEALLNQCGVAYMSLDRQAFWYQESVRNSELVHDALVEKAPGHTWAAVELTFRGTWTVTELIAAHGAAAVCEAPPVWGSNYRRAPILMQEVLASHHIRYPPDLVVPLIDPHAGTWTDELADVLPRLPAPWARQSRLPWWDMSITDPVNTTRPGTAAFDVLVLCACLQWEARWALDTGRPPLPSWLRLHDEHPLNVVMSSLASRRYGLEPGARPPDSWLSAATQAVVDRWAAREIDLVARDD
jgi:hypothetical protein